MTRKGVLWAAITLLVVFGAGWYLGASGRSALAIERRALEEHAALSDAQAALLEARLSFADSNFGDARRQLEAARVALSDVQVRLRETGQPERAGNVEIVLAHIKDADRLAALLDRSADQATASALQALAALRK